MIPALLAVQRNGTGTPLFCATPAYGDAVALSELARLVDPEQPFYILQPPLRRGVCPVQTREELTQIYLREIRKIQRDGPYRIAGYCSGGLAAFELARQLTFEGETVEKLLLLDVPFGLSTTFLRIDAGMRALASKFLSRGMVAKSRVLQTIDAGVHDEALTAHVRLFRDYLPTDYPGSIVLFEAAWSPVRLLKHREFWRKTARGGLVTCKISGHHNNFLRRYGAELAGHVRHYLIT